MSSATPESNAGDGESYSQNTSIAPQNVPSSDANVLKVTRGHSCILCQSRKVRCDKSKPCSNCIKAGVECRVIPPQPPRRRKKRVAERDLVERLRKYEALLTQNGIEFDGLGPDVKITDPGSVQEGDELDSEFVRIKDPPTEVDPELISSPGETPHVPRTFKWFPFHKEFRVTNEMIRESSDEDDMGITINHAYDKIFDNSDGFPFIVGAGPYKSLTDQHPSAIHIFQLWQLYLNNVNPLLKLTHTPTLQGRIIEASANLDKVSKSLEALMFSIYFVALTSLQDDQETLEVFGEERPVLLRRYHAACQQALHNAGFMRTPDLTLLQSYLLYLISVRHYMDPRSLFCLSGIGVRLAYRMGLHRDGAQFNLSPFEVEERRRLWWTLAGFDRRIGEMTGSTITAISNGGDCKLPLNINDADLHLDAKDPPKPHAGATEMIFALPRLEFSKAPGSDKMKSVLSEANPQAVTNLADHRLLNYLQRYETYLEDTYLKYCDPKVPLHFFSLMMSRGTISKLKVLAGFFKVALSTPAPLSQAEKEELFIESIKMIEYDSMIQANESLKGYLWYTNMHFPFPGYVCLIKELRHRTTGELCERGWQTMFENHELRKMTTRLRSPMHIALNQLFVKAWDAREAAEAQMGRSIAPPRLIVVMRQLVARFGQKAKSKTPDPGVNNNGNNPSAAQNTFTSGPGPQVPGPAPAPGPNMQMFPNNDVWTGVPGMDINNQFSGAFADVSFGGEVDWQYLMSEYGGYPQQIELGTMQPSNPGGGAVFWH